MLDNPKQFLNSLPNSSGVYQMYDDKQQILYVGKAKNLRKRLSSYFRFISDPKTNMVMELVKNIEIIITPNEHAALLLESYLIKAKKPRYNILFKDDKSFPYIHLSSHDFPRLSVYRGAVVRLMGKCFGPFPDVAAVNFVLDLLQKIFRLRACKDNFMGNRSRPCTLYQIRRCSAPCVGYIDKSAYALQVKLVAQFLESKSDHVIRQLTKLMDEAAAKLAYEQAANYRDQIASIRKVQFQQAITKTSGNIDVIALLAKGVNVCVNMIFVRNGLVIGNKTYFPTKTENFILSATDVLSSFIMHYYLQDRVNNILPDKILINLKLPERLKLMTIFQEKFKHKIMISNQVRGAHKQLLTMAEINAYNSWRNQQQSVVNYAKCLLDFKQVFGLSKIPERVECFDVSHTMGEAEVASNVVFKKNGPSKNEYRRFNIRSIKSGDDYGALREVLYRRLNSLKDLPDVIIIDGGKGQMNVAIQVLHRLQINGVLIIAIAKGQERKPGLEEIYVQGKSEAVVLSPQSPGFHFLQQIRDEAHRFAISGHRRRMIRSRHQSVLEVIPGVGRAKRALLLRHFGGMTELSALGVDELAKVKGVGKKLAQRIYEYLHA